MTENDGIVRGIRSRMNEQVGTERWCIPIAVSENLVLGAGLRANHPRQVEDAGRDPAEAGVATVAKGEVRRQGDLGPTGRLV